MPRTLRFSALVVPALLAATLFPITARAQGDTLRVGSPSVRALVLTPGTDTSLTYGVRNGERRLLATYVEEVTATPDGYLLVGRNVRANGAVLSLDTVAVAKGTLAPLWHADSTRAGRLRVEYAGGRMRGTLTDTAGARTAVDSLVPPGLFDYSAASRVVNLLPLAPGYTVVLPSWDIHRGAQYTRLAVLGEESFDAGGTAVPAWKVEMDYGRFKATQWIHRETRRTLRTTVMAGGMEMVVEYR